MFTWLAMVQAMGAFFALSTMMLAISLGRNELISVDEATMSVAALVPSFIGIYAGRWTRDQIDEAQFQKIFLIGVLLLGTYLTWRSIAVLT